MRLRARGAAQHAGWEHTRGERGLSTARRTLNVDSVDFVRAVERSSRARKRRDESRPLAASKTRAPSRLRAPTRQARLAPPPEGEGASRLANSLSRGGASLAGRQYGRAPRARTHGCSGKLPAAESCAGNGCSAPRTASESRLGSAVSGLSCPGPRPCARVVPTRRAGRGGQRQCACGFPVRLLAAGGCRCRPSPFGRRRAAVSRTCLHFPGARAAGHRRVPVAAAPPGADLVSARAPASPGPRGGARGRAAGSPTAGPL